jgi:hypothetical protein
MGDPAPIPRSVTYAKRSGIGPQRALEAITKAPRAPRESPILPRASSASAGLIPRSPTTHPPTRPTTPVPSPDHFRTACPQSFCKGIQIVQSVPFCVIVRDRPRANKYAKRSGIGPQRALEAINKSPRAPRESPILPRASSASAGLIPRSPTTHPPTRPTTPVPSPDHFRTACPQSFCKGIQIV